MDAPIESDRLLNFPHPRERASLIGQGRAEEALLKAYLSGRPHHAWALTGPKGIGKATLAYRFARRVLRNSDILEETNSLEVPESAPIFQQVAAQSHPDLFVARRSADQRTGRLRTELTIDEIRNLRRFLSRTAGLGGWRVCIIDAADDMNASSANALLKVLEEPPPKTIILLISHVPQRLLATIRSRCVTLALNRLAPDHLRTIAEQLLPTEDLPSGDDFETIIELSGGSAGRALELIAGGGLTIDGEITGLLNHLPRLDTLKLHKFAEGLAGRADEQKFHLFCSLLTDRLASLITSFGEGSQHHLFAGSGRARWAESWQQINHSIQRANALNLDRKQLVLQIFFVLQETAQSVSPD